MGRKHHKPCQLGGGKNPCAWCHLHKITMSPRQMKGRKCLKKKCSHLVPYKQHPVWAQKQRSRELRAKKKEEQPHV